MRFLWITKPQDWGITCHCKPWHLSICSTSILPGYTWQFTGLNMGLCAWYFVKYIKACFIKYLRVLWDTLDENWGLRCQKQVPQTGNNNCIPHDSVGCNYLSMPEIPAPGTKVAKPGIDKRLYAVVNNLNIPVMYSFRQSGALGLKYTLK